jgi:hypothetical protein
MSVENKIREMMNGKINEAFPGMGKNREDSSPMQGSSQKPEVQSMHKDGVSAAKPGNPVNKLAAGAGAKESAPMKQGSSEDAKIDSEDTQDTQGKTQSAKAKKQPVPTTKGAGAAPNYTTVVDPSSVINQASSKGNVYKEEAEEAEEVSDEILSEEEFEALSDEEKAEYELVETELEVEETPEETEEEEEEEVLTQEEYDALSEEEQAEYEEVEQIDELSNKTLSSYVDKAKASRREADNKSTEKYLSISGSRKSMKRSAGITNAYGKMKEELANDVDTLLSSEADLSEEFKSKAASLFEAVVTARVAHEVEIMEDILAEQAADVVAEMHEELVDKVDAYLSYVTEQWMEANAVAIEEGLRAEITEDFIAGLKVLFKENFIEVPEEKYDVLGEMQEEIEALTAKVNEAIEANIELSSELNEANKEVVFARVTADLARTEAEKLRGLVEEVEFENEALFEEKLSVIKNSYFPKTKAISPIIEDTAVVQEVSGTVAKYAELLGRNNFRN